MENNKDLAAALRGRQEEIGRLTMRIGQLEAALNAAGRGLPSHPAAEAMHSDPTALGIVTEALRFYADGQHFVLHDADAWDTVSGEPQNWQEDDANTATIEDGSVAKLALEQIAGAPRIYPGTAGPAVQQAGERNQWQPISTLPYSDDLVWLKHSDTIDGPRAMETDDYDRYSEWASCTYPRNNVDVPSVQQAGDESGIDPNVFFDALADFKDTPQDAAAGQVFFDKLVQPAQQAGDERARPAAVMAGDLCAPDGWNVERRNDEIDGLVIRVSHTDKSFAILRRPEPTHRLSVLYRYFDQLLAEQLQSAAASGQKPIGYLAAHELGRLESGHDANLRSAKFGPSPLDGDVPVYVRPAAVGAADLLAAQPAQQPLAVPEGFALVPLVPTDAMCRAPGEGWNVLPSGVAEMYKRILAAAPAQAPTAMASIVNEATLRNWLALIHDNERSIGDRLQCLSSTVNALLNGQAYPPFVVREQSAAQAPTVPSALTEVADLCPKGCTGPEQGGAGCAAVTGDCAMDSPTAADAGDLSNEQIRTIMHNYSRMHQPGHYSDTEFDCLQDVIGFARALLATVEGK